jgi:hypothetical protein
MRTPFALLAAAALAAPAAAADPALAPGNYRLAYLPRPLTEIPLALLKVEADDGKPAVSTLDKGTQRAEASGLEVSPGGVKFAVELGGGQAKLRFEGKPDPKDPKRLVGSLGDDDRVFPAELTPTDAEKLDARPKPPELPAALKDAQKLAGDAMTARMKAAREKDADAKKKLQDEAAEAAKTAEVEVPALYKKVVADAPGTPAAAVAAGELLDRLGKLTATPDEAQKWADEAVGYAAKYGQRIERATRIKVAEALAGNDKLAPAALPYAEPVATSDAPAGDRLKAYKVLAVAYGKGGRAELAAVAKKEIDKMELVLDKEYQAKVPPFKPSKFGGRKDAAANRVTVFELFTGAQCPPCVAADVGFDALVKAYKPADVVLLQYHMHIPGPDPLTNPTSLARWEYYGDKFPKDMRGTPSTLVNGKPGGGGGGGMANAEKKFKEFRNLLDPALEATTGVTLDGSAKRAGDEVAATVAVTPGKDAPEKATLRLLLVEENVRYLGGNGVRFHHHVVRATFGDPAGVRLADLKDGKHAAAVRLTDVRKSLEAYLDEAAKERPFPTADRPTALGALKVVALVQDDETGEIVQALELPVAGG